MPSKAFKKIMDSMKPGRKGKPSFMTKKKSKSKKSKKSKSRKAY